MTKGALVLQQDEAQTGKIKAVKNRGLSVAVSGRGRYREKRWGHSENRKKAKPLGRGGASSHAAWGGEKDLLEKGTNTGKRTVQQPATASTSDPNQVRAARVLVGEPKKKAVYGKVKGTKTGPRFTGEHYTKTAGEFGKF